MNLDFSLLTQFKETLMKFLSSASESGSGLIEGAKGMGNGLVEGVKYVGKSATEIVNKNSLVILLVTL